MIVRRWFQAALSFALVGLAASSARAAGFDDFRYTAGHADLSVGFENGELTLFYEFGSSAVLNGSAAGAEMEVDASQVTTVLHGGLLTTGASGLPSPFAGSPLYVLGQTSQGAATRPFLGLGADSVAPGLFVDDLFTLSVTGFSQRPDGGEMVIWQNGAAGSPDVNTADGFSPADSIGLFALGHDHFNFGFTASGIYDVVFSATGTLLGGQTLTTTGVFRFEVDYTAGPAVPEPASVAMMGLGAAAVGLVAVRKRRKA